jgi:hypothetical protein
VPANPRTCARQNGLYGCGLIPILLGDVRVLRWPHRLDAAARCPRGSVRGTHHGFAHQVEVLSAYETPDPRR